LLMWCTYLLIWFVLLFDVIYMNVCIMFIALGYYLHVCSYYDHNLLMCFTCFFALFTLLIYMLICIMFITCWCDLHTSLHYFHNSYFNYRQLSTNITN